jgi:hypothetical protein
MSLLTCPTCGTAADTQICPVDGTLLAPVAATPVLTPPRHSEDETPVQRHKPINVSDVVSGPVTPTRKKGSRNE